MSNFTIHLHLINQHGQALPNLNVQVWINDQQMSDALTDTAGRCTAYVTLPANTPKKVPPFVYFLIYKEGQWIYGEKNNPKYPVEGTELDLQLTLPVNNRRVDNIPFNLADLRTQTDNLDTLTGTQRDYIANKLNTALLTAVQRALSEADGRFQEQPIALTLNYTELLDATIGEVLVNKALPVIATTRTFEVESNLEERLAQNIRPVREILHLDLPLIKNPIFWEEVQVLRTTGLTDILLPGYSDLPDQMLERAWDWERASAEQWDALGLTQADKSILQRGFALSRFTGGLPALVGGLMQEITDLSQMVTYDADHLLARIFTYGGETPNGETPEEYAANLVSLAQRNFPSAFFLERKVQREIQIADIDENAKQRLFNTYRHLGPVEELNQPDVLNRRRGLLKQFIIDNPGFDLRTADFFKKQENDEWAYQYSGIPEERRAAVRQQMMSLQRVMHLSGSYEAQEALLAAGYDSSADLLRRGPAGVQADLGDALDPAVIAGILQNAQSQVQLMTNAAVALQGVATNLAFAVENYPADLVNQLQDIDGYADMFGSPDFCACEHCKSIFGPAAYFVDLMKFTEENVTLLPPPADPAAHPIALQKRRPDLPHLELTCENTNAAIPYLQIVNEVMQGYIAAVVGPIVGQTPQTVNVWDVFKDAGWKYSFRLAFNRPYEESRLLLHHAGIRYADVLQALRVMAQYRMDQAYIDLSGEEWQIITTPDTNLADLRALRFGFPDDRQPQYDVNILLDPGFSLAKCPVDVFLRATGLGRADAEFLLSAKSHLGKKISAAVKWVRKPVSDDLHVYEEWIEGLDNAAVLDFIHRLLRLQQHLPWTLRKLDLVVQALGSLDIGEIVRITRIREVQRLLDLSVEEALALHNEIPNTSLQSRAIFNERLNSTVETPVPGMLERMFGAGLTVVRDASDTTLRDYKKWPELLSGLSGTEGEFGRKYMAAFGSGTLNLTKASDAYRITRLARALGLSLESLAYLIQLSGLEITNLNAGRILNWLDVLKTVKAMPLSLHEVWFILKGEETSKIAYRYKGDATRDKTASDAALTLMTAFVQDVRLAQDKLAALGTKEKALLLETVFGEHLALLFKTSVAQVKAMAPWYQGLGLLMQEAQNNLSVSVVTYQTARLVGSLPVFERLMLLFEKLGLDAADLEFFNQSTELIQGTGADALEKLKTVYDLRRFSTYARLKKKAEKDLDVNAFRILLNADKSKWADDHGPALAALLSCELYQVKALYKAIAAFSISAPDLLHQLEDMARVFGKLALYDTSVLNALRMNTYADALKYESALRAAFRAGYATEAAYEKGWEPLENRINELRRDVLCAFLLALDRQNNFRDMGDLYAYFLADVEMSGCARVSRILEGILAIQMYIHRVLMGLEVSTKDAGSVRAILSDKAKIQWEWRKNYRVWEANRKVFLYPENWIEPELRDDKSPLFKALEDELLQQKISLESAEQAYIQYLKDFAEVGQLVITGIYYEDDPDVPVYHIFGRTATDPYQYYYRKLKILGKPKSGSAGNLKWESRKYWTAWEKVELAIEGSYVSPIIYRNKLYIFWVSIVTQEKSKFEGGDSKFEKFEISYTLRYSCLQENGKWLQSQIVKNFFNGDNQIGFSLSNAEDAVKALHSYENSVIRNRVFPWLSDNKINIDYYRRPTSGSSGIRYGSYQIDLFANKAIELGPSIDYNNKTDSAIYLKKLNMNNRAVQVSNYGQLVVCHHSNEG